MPKKALKSLLPKNLSRLTGFFFGSLLPKKNSALVLALTASGKNKLGQRGGGVFSPPLCHMANAGFGAEPQELELFCNFDMIYA